MPLILSDFEANKTSGIRFLNVQFIDLSEGGGINSWLWTFGDGGASTEQNPLHFYSHPGIYSVSLTVSNGLAQDTEIKNQYINIRSKYVYDVAPNPDMKAYLYGTGSANKLNIGIKINAMNLLINNE